MRKIWKRVTAAALSLTFVLSLSACGGGLSADDATTYVQGILDENYKGVYDPDFLELIDITENEAEETYLSSLETEADFFASAFLIDDLTDELKAEVVDMYKQVYAKAKYTVDTATEVDDGTFGVKVTVEPLDVFDRVAEALWGDTPDARAEALYSQDVDSMTDEEYAAYDAEWCRLVIDLTLEKLPEAEYLEAQSKVVQITLGDDNYWSLDEQDFIEDSYIMEISSPGLDRPLKKEKDFARSIGKLVEIRTYRPIEKQKEFCGELTAYDNNSVTIDEEGTPRTFDKKDIALVRLAIDF